MTSTRLIAALDTQSEEEALAWAKEVRPHVDAFKLGMEFSYAAGLDAVRRFAAQYPLFLDLKLHDIPNTVAKALASLAPIGAALTTIHAGGVRAMIAAARRAL